ncbi:amidohydrolase [Ornithinimicrobium cryptoxanthini]|uniref:Amidohydrolase n=1 Tax=Ornithinimicrobium cryptoxanthini TaxID=2934161 RepID=A0ABY4YKG3_9MICO|nr:amidohydrolase [Ornithinimicrobium cryptoxanthini]USQ77206.1 amidohydrolase [Ornithinimicrobium cryptoxanthini]
MTLHTTPPASAPLPTPEALVEDVVEWVETHRGEIIALRRDLHEHPEVSWQEHRTTSVVIERLEAVGVMVTSMAGTGAIADLGASEPRVRIALRADLDALPLDEETGLPFASRQQGVCHACGHDVHTAGVLAAGLALASLQDRLESMGVGVRLIFQPAEESIPGGAHKVVEDGWLEGVDRVLAVHCDPSIDVGTIGLKVGPITAASDSVHVTLTGRGGHTSRPHLTQDLTYALGKVITEVPAALSRRMDPRSGTALVWGAVRAGTVANVIPSRGEVVGTLRMLDSETWVTTGPLIEEIVHAVVSPYGVTAEVRHVRGVPPVDNDAASVAAMTAAVGSVLGPTAVVPTRQSLGGEDLGWLLTDIPGAMARLGTRTPGGPTHELHQGDLIVDEESVLIAGKFLAAAVLSSVGPDGLL